MAEPVEWQLVGSNGTCIKLKDLHLERDWVEVPDCDNPGVFTREPFGLVRLTATVDGIDAAADRQQPPRP